MVYFIAKLYSMFSQIKLEKENAKGKSIKISNIPQFINILIIDFGFEGYNP